MDQEKPNGAQRTIAIPDPVVVRDLAFALQMKPHAVVAGLMDLNFFVSIATQIDFATASSLCSRYGVVAHKII